MNSRIDNPRDRFSRKSIDAMRQNLKNGIRPTLTLNEATLKQEDIEYLIELQSIALFWQEE